MFALDRGATVTADATGHLGIRGTRRCASPWSCPVCSATIAERRALEVDQAVTAWRRDGGSVVFVTATLRHHLGQSLGDLLVMVQDSWSHAFRFRRRPSWYGGQIRAVEITHGVNGWHPHVHAAVFVKPGHSFPAALMAGRWRDGVESNGGTTDIASGVGFDVRETTDSAGLGSYLSKVSGGWGVGLELARSDRKRGRKGGLSPWQLLDLSMSGDLRARRLWMEYDKATAGRRCLVFSPGLKAACGLDDLSDADLAEGDAPESPTVIVFIPAEDWRRLLRGGWLGRLQSDIVELATGAGDGWPWPPGWLLRHRPCSVLLHMAA